MAFRNIVFHRHFPIIGQVVRTHELAALCPVQKRAIRGKGKNPTARPLQYFTAMVESASALRRWVKMKKSGSLWLSRVGAMAASSLPSVGSPPSTHSPLPMRRGGRLNVVIDGKHSETSSVSFRAKAGRIDGMPSASRRLM
jgi:hypothetical protein